MDAVLPLEVELFLPRGDEREPVTGELGPGGRQYLSRSEVGRICKSEEVRRRLVGAMPVFPNHL
jgi:hypothetical protein